MEIHHYHPFGKTSCGQDFPNSDKPDKNKWDKINSDGYFRLTYRLRGNDYIITTYEFEKITCAGCKDFLKTKLYYCNVHGFVHRKEVTFDEHCVYCGNHV